MNIQAGNLSRKNLNTASQAANQNAPADFNLVGAETNVTADKKTSSLPSNAFYKNAPASFETIATLVKGDDKTMTLEQALGRKPTKDEELFYNIYKELVETNTVTRAGFSGSTLAAAQKLEKFFLANGFSANDARAFQLTDKDGKLIPNKGVILARIGGKTNEPGYLFASHMDELDPDVKNIEVDEIGADGKPTGKKISKSNWDTDPNKLEIVKGPFGAEFRGRAVIDSMYMIAAWAANMVRLKNDPSFKPDMPLYFAGTTDEELGNEGDNGMKWIIDNKSARDFIGTNKDGKLNLRHAFNEGSSGVVGPNGEYEKGFGIDTSQKTYLDIDLVASGKGVHGSRAMPTDALNYPIIRVAEAQKLLAITQLPIQLNDTVIQQLKDLAEDSPDANTKKEIAYLLGNEDKGNKQWQKIPNLIANPDINNILRTTVAPSMISAANAPNKVSDTAQAVVNVRIQPVEGKTDFVDNNVALLRDILDKAGFKDVSLKPRLPYATIPAYPTDQTVVNALQQSIDEVWPGQDIKVRRKQLAGGTDNRYTMIEGIPSTGTYFTFLRNEGDMHSPNEQVGVKEVFTGYDLMYRFMKRLGNAPKK